MKTLLLGMALALLFVSADSFWIDEGNTAYKASQSTLVAWWYAMHSVTGSDSQMPGYMFYVWCWEKIVPNSEFFLRLSNLPWLAVLFLSLRRFPFALAFAITSPFIIFYLSEFRPYLMQLAGAALVIRGLVDFHKTESKSWVTVLTGCLILSLASLIGVVWSLGALIYVLADSPQRLRTAWFWKISLGFAPFYAVLAAYYAWTLSQGQEAAMMGGGLFVSVGAAAYELLGLAGLGPGKAELRIDPSSVIRYMPLIAPAVLASGILIYMGLYQWVSTTPWKRVLPAALAVGLPLCLLLALVIFKDFRLLGRHLAPLSILMTLLFAKVAAGFWTSQPGAVRLPTLWLVRAVVLLVLGFGVTSNVALRFAERHRKDDYRGAASIAHQAMKEDRPVIWIADKWTAHYYGLNEQKRGWTDWREPQPIPELTGDEIILYSKPDIYDSLGRFSEHLKVNGFSNTHNMPAFKSYKRTP
jgi:hypothetical protein